MKILVIDERDGAMRKDFSNVKNFTNNFELIEAGIVIYINQDGVTVDNRKGDKHKIGIWEIKGEPKLSAENAKKALDNRLGKNDPVDYEAVSQKTAERADRVFHGGNHGIEPVGDF